MRGGRGQDSVQQRRLTEVLIVLVVDDAGIFTPLARVILVARVEVAAHAGHHVAGRPAQVAVGGVAFVGADDDAADLVLPRDLDVAGVERGRAGAGAVALGVGAGQHRPARTRHPSGSRQQSSQGETAVVAN